MEIKNYNVVVEEKVLEVEEKVATKSKKNKTLLELIEEEETKIEE
jgi:hypothetical protein